MIKVWTFDEFVSSELPVLPYLVDPLIPKSGVTLLHGPAGVGKSALGFHLSGVLGRGKDFLGLGTTPTASLYLNLEMPEDGLQYRLSRAGYRPPAAYLINHPPIDLLQPGFQLTPIFTELRSVVRDLNVGCVTIDNLGCLNTLTTAGDEVARRTIATLREWFDDRAVLLLHHDRKMVFSQQAGTWITSNEDAAGSKYWQNSVVSVVRVFLQNAQIRVLRHTKSQVMKIHDEDIQFVLGADGVSISLWTEKRKDDLVGQLSAAEAKLRTGHPDWDQLTETDRVELIAELLGKSPATIYRWKAQVKEER